MTQPERAAREAAEPEDHHSQWVSSDRRIGGAPKSLSCSKATWHGTRRRPSHDWGDRASCLPSTPRMDRYEGMAPTRATWLLSRCKAPTSSCLPAVLGLPGSLPYNPLCHSFSG